MKKRFPALILALALCFGLAVPAFAADEGEYLYDLKFATPGGSVPPMETFTCQLRDVQEKDDVYTYAEKAETSAPVSAYALSLGTTVTVGGLRSEDNQLIDAVTFIAWSDPDGDGVYQKRLFALPVQGTSASVVPLTEKGPFKPTDDMTYWPLQLASALGFKAAMDSSGYVSVSFTADQLNELFGPNTLLIINVVDAKTVDIKMTATILLTGKAAPAPAPEFTDVPSWCSDAVDWAVEQSVTNGTSTTKFSPDDECTQAQILTMLWRAAGEPEAAGELPFVVADAYRGAILWASDMSMIDPGTFDPNAACTRSAAVQFICQAFGIAYESPVDCGFEDVDADAGYAYAVAWAVENGITNGDGSETIFSPDKVCTRAQIVTFLHRAYVEEARLTSK